ncbi:MAG: phosphodiester glycosidase family protein [Hyphomonadaceae bacterium]|nr:phosphodiester glycosidase family protein [Hyphomonadaceae bacterium]
MLRALALTTLLCALAWSALGDHDTAEPDKPSPCETLQDGTASYTVCQFPLTRFAISLHLAQADGTLFGQPLALEAELREAGHEVIALTNGGMYHADRRPVGLYVEQGETLRPLVRGDGPGNFQMLPNGVFWIENGRAGVEETEAYAEAVRTPDFATQSGPMLVLDGEVHPAFRVASDSRFRRSGIGVSEDGRHVTLAISEQPVTFHAFASLFRDRLSIDNALFIDGKVCRLDLPGEGRHEPGLRMGPILAVTARPVETEPDS